MNLSMPNFKSRNRSHSLDEKSSAYTTTENKKVVERTSAPKLNMQRVEVYDSTDGRVAVVQKPVLLDAFDKQYRRGLKHGLLSTSGAVMLTTFPLLTTVKEHQNFLGIQGATWHAIYFLLLAVSVFAFIVLLIINLLDWWLDNHNVEVFFRNDRKLE